MPIDPDNMYVRIAKVERIAITSREVDISFIDGEEADTSLYRAEVVFGSETVGEDLTPSAAVVNVGDRVAVIVSRSRYLVVTRLDRFEYNNSNRVAIYPLDVINTCLGGLCLRCEYDPGNYSYADFYVPPTQVWNDATGQYDDVPERVIRLENSGPSPTYNRIADRLFSYLNSCGQNNLSYAKVDDESYPYENLGGGPMTAAPVKIGGTIRQGLDVNHLQFVEDMPFGRTDYSGDLSIYSPTLTSLDQADVHPLVADVLGRIQFDHNTVLWFDDDDPQWVVSLSVYPAWSTAPYIKITEIPVKGWAERARNDDEDTAAVVGDSARVCYLRNGDLVRDLVTITRNWVDWSVLATDPAYSEFLHRSPVFTAKRISPDKWAFCITDGYPYSDGEYAYQVNQIKRLYGVITRKIAEDPTSNGSPYDYDIFMDNPLSGYTDVQTYYLLDWHYWSTPSTGSTYYPNTSVTDQVSIVYTDSVNELTKKVDFSCDIDGAFTDNPMRSGRIKWS